MSIAWIYLDKKSAAVSAIKDYNDMEFIINNTPDDIADVRSKMTTAKTPTVSDMPKGTPDPHAGEARLAAQLDELDIIKERYRRALEYMEWFRPAWEELAETERIILTEYYMAGNQKSGATKRLELRLNYGHSQIDNLRSKALSRLTVLLFGK